MKWILDFDSAMTGLVWCMAVGVVFFLLRSLYTMAHESVSQGRDTRTASIVKTTLASLLLATLIGTIEFGVPDGDYGPEPLAVSGSRQTEVVRSHSSARLLSWKVFLLTCAAGALGAISGANARGEVEVAAAMALQRTMDSMPAPQPLPAQGQRWALTGWAAAGWACYGFAALICLGFAASVVTGQASMNGLLGFMVLFVVLVLAGALLFEVDRKHRRGRG